MLSKILRTQKWETEMEEDQEIFPSSSLTEFSFRKGNMSNFKLESLMTESMKHKHLGRALNRVHRAINICYFFLPSVSRLLSLNKWCTS